MSAESAFCTIEAAMAILGRSRNFVYTRLREGKLLGHQKNGWAWYLSRESVEAFVPTYGPGRRAPGQPQQSQAERAHERQQEMARCEHMTTLVLAAVCAVCEVTPEELVGGRRLPNLIDARRTATYLLMHDVGLGPMMAGRILHRDHSTSCHHNAVMRARIAAKTLSYEDRWTIRACRQYVRDQGALSPTKAAPCS